MALNLRDIVHHRYGSFIPGGFSVRANVLRRAKYDVGEQAYLTADGKVSLRLLLLALEQPVPTVHLPPIWRADDNAFYFLTQEENGTLWLAGLSSDPDPAVDTASGSGLQYGLSFTTVFQGQMGGSLIEGVWVDVPRGERLNSGWLSLKFTTTAGGSPIQLQKIASSGDGFGASVWGGTEDYPYYAGNTGDPADLDGTFNDVYKNQNAIEDHSLLDNLKPYKDSAVVFCTVDLDKDLPPDYTGPPWHVNYPPDVGRHYQDFICLYHNNSPPDGDLNIRIVIDRAQLERRTNFWTEGWYRNSDPIKQKLDEQGYSMHLEVIMFGRTAECGDADYFNSPPLYPGWQEMNGNSVLLNGRPINGQVEIGGPIQVDMGGPVVKNEWYVTSVGGKTIAKDTYLRVTGVIVLDCGHGATRPCHEDDSSYDNQEIHPVYAIDIIDPTSSDDLSGTWSDDDGRTFYLRRLADNTLWGLGMSPAKDHSFARVFQGTIQDDQLITVHWVDVTELGLGQSTGSMTIQTAGPGQTCLFDGSVCRFVSSSDSPVEQRWTKLYDIPRPV